jgi:hypothetical protein
MVGLWLRIAVLLHRANEIVGLSPTAFVRELRRCLRLIDPLSYDEFTRFADNLVDPNSETCSVHNRRVLNNALRWLGTCGVGPVEILETSETIFLLSYPDLELRPQALRALAFLSREQG